MSSHNHQRAGNMGKGEEELDNDVLGKSEVIIIVTFLEKPGKYLLACEQLGFSTYANLNYYELIFPVSINMT